MQILYSRPTFVQNKKTTDMKQYLNTEIFTKSIKSKNISFGDGGVGLIYLVARGGLDAIKNGPKHYNMIKLMEEIHYVIKNPNLQNNNKLADTLSALSKISDNSSDGALHHLISSIRGNSPFFTFFTGTNFDIGGLRGSAIDIISKTKDDSSVNIQSKKDFISSLFNNGHRIEEDHPIIEEFHNLSDLYYKAFKQETIDKALFSQEYAQKRTQHMIKYGAVIQGNDSITEEIIRGNLALINTLDPSMHAGYLKKLQPTVIKLKKELFNILKNSLWDRFICTENKFTKYECLKYESLLNEKDSDNYSKIFWDEVTNSFNYDKNKISKTLSLPKDIVEDMLADAKACNIIAKSSTTNEEKAKICLTRIDEKLANPNPKIKERYKEWIAKANELRINTDNYLEKKGVSKASEEEEDVPCWMTGGLLGPRPFF